MCDQPGPAFLDQRHEDVGALAVGGWPAGRLVVVEAHVCDMEGRLDRVRLGGQEGCAVRGADLERIAALGHRRPRRPDDVLGVVGGCEHAELVAAHPVGSAPEPGDGGLQPRAEPLQEQVARRMAEGVVVLLEPVQIEEREDVPAGIRPGEHVGEIGDEGAAVAHPRERIGARLLVAGPQQAAVLVRQPARLALRTRRAAVEAGKGGKEDPDDRAGAELGVLVGSAPPPRVDAARLPDDDLDAGELPCGYGSQPVGRGPVPARRDPDLVDPVQGREVRVREPGDAVHLGRRDGVLEHVDVRPEPADPRMHPPACDRRRAPVRRPRSEGDVLERGQSARLRLELELGADARVRVVREMHDRCERRRAQQRDDREHAQRLGAPAWVR